MKILIVVTLISTISWTTYAEDHPIYNQIIKNAPKIDKKYAFDLSNKIHKVTKKYNLNARIYTAILAQESMYKLDAINCVKGLHEVSRTPSKVCRDFGISQINFKNIPRFGFNIDLLLTDLEYSVEAGAKVLADVKKRIKNNKNYWVGYNCGTRNIHRKACKDYKKLVMRFM